MVTFKEPISLWTCDDIITNRNLLYLWFWSMATGDFRKACLITLIYSWIGLFHDLHIPQQTSIASLWILCQCQCTMQIYIVIICISVRFHSSVKIQNVFIHLCIKWRVLQLQLTEQDIMTFQNSGHRIHFM